MRSQKATLELGQETTQLALNYVAGTRGAPEALVHSALPAIRYPLSAIRYVLCAMSVNDGRRWLPWRAEDDGAVLAAYTANFV